MNHPMKPTPRQIKEWLAEAIRLFPMRRPGDISAHIARLAYAAGADAGLEACDEWLREEGLHGYANQLRAALRPKPPSLKQQGRNALAQIMSKQVGMFDGEPFEVLSRAIEALPEEAP